MIARVALVAVLVASALIFLGSSAVRAEGEVTTLISIEPIEPVVVGTRVEAIVTLRLANGAPVVDEPVVLTLNGEHVRRSRTKEGGSTAIRVPFDLPPGEYRLVASYAGRTGAYLASRADFVLEVHAFELNIETVPPLPGMVFTLDGERFEADADGVASIAVEQAGDHPLSVLDAEYRNPEQRAEFSRWNTELFGNEIVVRIPLSKPLQAGFDVYYQASQSFVDLDGEVVDPARVTSISLRSSLGTLHEFPDGTARWYKASRSVRRPNGLESVDVRYNVDSVEVDGSNVVNAGQQRFYVRPGDVWTIELLLYAARMTPRDALFGFAAGTAVTVAYPDGQEVVVRADADGVISIPWLARGLYRMTVADAPGWAPVVPVALSRDQEVELRVITYIDMLVALVVAAGFAFGLLHLGRPHLIPTTASAAGQRLGQLGRLPRRLASPAVNRIQRARLERQRAAAAADRVAHARAIGIEPLPAARARLAYPAPFTASGAVTAVVAGRRRLQTRSYPVLVGQFIPEAPPADVQSVALPAIAGPEPAMPVRAGAPLPAAEVAGRRSSTKGGGARRRSRPAGSEAVGAEAAVTAFAPTRTARRPGRTRGAATLEDATHPIGTGAQGATPSPAEIPASLALPETSAPAREEPARASSTTAPSSTRSKPSGADGVGRPSAVAAAPAVQPAATATAKTKAEAKAKASTRAKPEARATGKPRATASAKPKTTASAKPKATTSAKRKATTSPKPRATTSEPARGEGATARGKVRRALDSPSRPTHEAEPARASSRVHPASDAPPARRRSAGAREKSRSAAARDTVPPPSRRAQPLNDAIQFVMRRRGRIGGDASVHLGPVGDEQLRSRQLHALGIPDPGEGPVIDRSLVAGLPHGTLHGSSTGWRIDAHQACERCGMDLWSGAQFCWRCGLLQADVTARARETALRIRGTPGEPVEADPALSDRIPPSGRPRKGVA